MRLTAVVLAGLVAMAGCAKTPEPEAARPSPGTVEQQLPELPETGSAPGFESPGLGLAMKEVPPPFRVAFVEGEYVQLVPRRGDDSVNVLLVRPPNRAASELEAVIAQVRRDLEQQIGGRYIGREQVEGPFGPAFVVDGEFDQDLEVPRETVEVPTPVPTVPGAVGEVADAWEDDDDEDDDASDVEEIIVRFRQLCVISPHPAGSGLLVAYYSIPTHWDRSEHLDKLLRLLSGLEPV